MTYTKQGPFVDGAAPYLSAAVFNAIDVGLVGAAPTYSLDATTAGIDWTGATDSSAGLNTLLTSPPVGTYGNIVVRVPPGGKLRIDNTVTIDLARAGLTVPAGGLIIDATHINTTSGIAMQVTATAAPPDNAGWSGPKVGPFRLIGPGSTYTGTVGILLSSTVASGGQARHVLFESVTVETFGAGHKYGDNVYCVTWLNAHVKGNNIGVWGPAGTTNSGERVGYIGSTISDGVIGIQNDSTFRFHLTACSLDYNFQQQVYNTGLGTVELVECHVEKFITQSPPWFQLTDGTVKMIGGTIAGGGTYNASTAPAYIVQNDADPTYTDGVALFDAVTMDNALRTTSNFFASGTGATIIRRHTRTNQFQSAFICTATSMNLLSRGNFDAGVSLTDRWILNTDTATITSSGWTSSTIGGANGSAATSTDIARSGARSMKFTKTGAAGTALSFAVLVPIERSATAGVLGWIARTATLTGTVGVTTSYCTVSGDDTHLTQIGQTSVVNAATVDTNSFLTAANTWFAFNSGSARRAPAWASHVAVIVDLTNMGAGSVYIDDLVVTDS